MAIRMATAVHAAIDRLGRVPSDNAEAIATLWDGGAMAEAEVAACCPDRLAALLEECRSGVAP
jgi:hypothetical protein